MQNSSDIRKGKRMAELLDAMTSSNLCFSDSPLTGVKFMRSNSSMPRTPITYEPCIVIVAQGRKIGYLGDEVHTYDPCNYLVLSVPLPFECETVATPEEPMLGVSITLDAATISELLLQMDDSGKLSGPVPRGLYSTPLTDELIDATTRLLECLNHPVDRCILGPQIIREIQFRVLCGEQGVALRAVAARQSHFAQIARVLKRMHNDFNAEFDVGTLAQEANMSLSSFHSNFKAVTAASPLQYLKNVRLHKARMLMVNDGLNANTAAGKVGYESASQFSREFKRYFGSTPADEAAKMRSLAEAA